MRTWLAAALVIIGTMVGAATLSLIFITAGQVPVASAQETDAEVPPGNPVIGDDRPGDIEPEEDDTRYGLWALLAVCLIGAGGLLVSLERWEARRTDG